MGIAKHDQKQVRVGVCAILFAIWRVCDGFIFNKIRSPTVLRVIPLATSIYMWSYLQPIEKWHAKDILGAAG
jgi:hypothetical protein